MTQALKAVTFGLDGEIFAIGATHVWEILDVVPITEVPTAHPFSDRLINVRGRIVPLADLRIAFGMERKPPNPDTRVIVIEVDVSGERQVAGILADKVFDVTDLEEEEMESAPNVGMRWRKDFIQGIAKRGGDFIIVPDLDQIFANCIKKQPESLQRSVS